MILKNSNNDTCLSDSPIDGWVEIYQQELDAIRASRVVSSNAVMTLTVTPYQFKAALVQQGLYTQALAAVNSGDVLTQLAWAEAQTFVENDSHIVAIATALGKTTADIHNLFQLAGTLAP